MRIFVVGLFLVGCSHHPEFNRSDYAVRETPVPGILLIQPRVPADDDYLARAAGEECAARGFSFYDYAKSRRGDARAFCYKKERVPQLGLVFDPKVPMRVEDTGRHSPLHPGDVIQKIAGHEVHDVAEVKENIFIAARQGARSISVAIERSEIPFTLDCPLEESRSRIGTPETLAELRQKN